MLVSLIIVIISPNICMLRYQLCNLNITFICQLHLSKIGERKSIKFFIL